MKDCVDKYIKEVWVWEKLNKIFFENRTEIQIRERYSDYLRYVMNFGERNAQMYVVKKYGISRQRVSDMVSIYNKKLKKEWDL